MGHEEKRHVSTPKCKIYPKKSANLWKKREQKSIAFYGIIW